MIAGETHSLAWTTSSFLLIGDQLKHLLSTGWALTGIERAQYGFRLTVTNMKPEDDTFTKVSDIITSLADIAKECSEEQRVFVDQACAALDDLLANLAD